MSRAYAQRTDCKNSSDTACREEHDNRDIDEYITVTPDSRVRGTGVDPMGGYNPWQHPGEADGQRERQGGSRSPESRTLEEETRQQIIENTEKLHKTINEKIIESDLNLSQKELAQWKVLNANVERITILFKAHDEITEDIIRENADEAFYDAINFMVLAGMIEGGRMVGSTSPVGALLGALMAAAAPSVADAIESLARDAELYRRASEMFASVSDTYRAIKSNTSSSAVNKHYNEFKCRTMGGFCPDFQIPPIILDMDGGGVDISNINSDPTLIDYDNDGYLESVSWLRSKDAVLFYDINNSGTLDSIKEMAIAHLAGDGKTDLDGLTTLDSNGDGRIDSYDAAYGQLFLWLDDGDAVFDSSEMISLEGAGIHNISLKGDGKYKMLGSSLSRNTVTFSQQLESGEVLKKLAYDVTLKATTNGIIRTDYGQFAIVKKEAQADSVDFANSSNPIDFMIGSSSLKKSMNYDSIRGSRFDDSILTSTDAPVYIDGYHGNDTIEGGIGEDVLLGGSGDDDIKGNSGHDNIRGNSGNDYLYGGDGNDVIDGGPGADYIFGGRGNDIMSGGAGKDIFLVSSGSDNISDFQVGIDKLEVNGMSEEEVELALSKSRAYKGGTFLRLADNSYIYFERVELGSITLNDFIINK